jgi:acetoin utilization protein AcuB
MIANDLISQSVPTVQTSDTGDEVLNLMQIYHVRHLPIVNHEQFLGLISEEDILIHDASENIGSYRLSYLRPYCHEGEHLFEVMAKIGRFQLSIIPIVDQKENYVGSITMEDLIQYFTKQYAFTNPGSIIVLESAKGDYSLSEIARIAESEDVQILSSFAHAIPDQSRMHITIKVNKQDIHTLKATYERFGYTVSAAFAELEQYDGLKERYDSLMNYLNV